MPAAGGKNNGASSGVWKSTDMGKHWTVASKGLWDTRINALGVVKQEGPDAGKHVFVSTPGAVYESTDYAGSWTRVNVSTGSCYTFKNGTVNNEKVIFASCDGGIANYNINSGKWSMFGPGGWGRAGYLSVSDSLGSNSVLGGCLGGHVWIGTEVNATHADWNQTNASRPCVMYAS